MSITEETHHKNYDTVKSGTNQCRAAILKVLAGNELTACEIAGELYMRGAIPYECNMVAPILTELKLEDKVKIIAKRFCEETGDNVAVGAITEGVEQPCRNR